MNGLSRLCAIVCALSLAAVGAYVEQRSACGLSAAQGNGVSAKLPAGTIDHESGDGGDSGTGSAGPVAEGTDIRCYYDCHFVVKQNVRLAVNTSFVAQEEGKRKRKRNTRR